MKWLCSAVGKAVEIGGHAVAKGSKIIHEHMDVVVVRSSKKSPLLSRMIVFCLIMICGVYICSVCMKQVGFRSVPMSLKVDMVEQQCNGLASQIDRIPHVHFPQPSTYSRDECACTPVRFFAILSTQRSGSGWFETLLNSHINISSNGEIFSNKVRRSNISTISATLDKVYNLEWYSSASKNECTAAVGLKWMLNQGLMMNHEGIARYFNERGVSIIFLFRKNLLRRLVSMLANSHDRDTRQLNGTHKAHVHSRHEADVLARFKPAINASSLIATLKHMDRWTSDALRYFDSTRHIVVYYEDLVTNRTMLMDVLDFLAVPQRKLVSRHVKIHMKPLSEQVMNWEDVCGVLKGTPYESFLQAEYKLL